MTHRTLPTRIVLGALLALVVAGCSEEAPMAECEPGRIYCQREVALTCQADGLGYDRLDCGRSQEVCHEGRGCVLCHPQGLSCDGDDVVRCDAEGLSQTLVTSCDVASGQACYLGNCVEACVKADQDRSYMGCEYWVVDLDNARVSATENAAIQQFAVVVSNVSGMAARVVVDQNDAEPGWPLDLRQVAEEEVPPQGLRVIRLASREVDGSPLGEQDRGTHSAISSRAYRVRSNVPIVAYQFNPLSNVDVFSNDASLLVPTSALDDTYYVLGWPQTIARTTNPLTNFDKNLRVFLTLVGTEPGTDVAVTVTTAVVGAPGIPALQPGDTAHFSLGPFDVVNLETGDYLADFTGSLVQADRPVAVFSGSEASDVPYVPDLTTRICCADHLEHQLFPLSAAGVEYIAARTPQRTPVVQAAGGTVSIVAEPEYFRILATQKGTEITTTLPPPNDYFILDAGQHVTIEAWCDFKINATRPIFVGQFTASQGVTGIALAQPGGDPSFIMVPPVEQWRAKYVFLTPDQYAFDFAIIVAPLNTQVLLDEMPLPEHCEVSSPVCTPGPDPEEYVIYRCQLSFPIVHSDLPPPDNVEPGIQDDGYHLIRAARPFGLVVYGFDKHVSYGYAGGLDMKRINVQ